MVDKSLPVNCSKCQSAPLVKKQSMNDEKTHHGISLGYSSNKVILNIHGSQLALELPTHSGGSRFMFQVERSILLQPYLLTTHVSMVMNSRTTYITCSSLCNMHNKCNGLFVVYMIHNVCVLGIVSSMFYLQNHRSNGVLDVYRWKGSVVENGVPAFLLCNNWADMSIHFELLTVNLEDIELYFVNQICRKVWLGGTPNLETRNPVDGGIQCSSSGPDQVPSSFNIPIYLKHSKSSNLSELHMQNKYSHIPDLCIPNQRLIGLTMRGRRYKKKSANNEMIVERDTSNEDHFMNMW